MSCIDREELDAVSNHISNLPTIGALYAPVLVKHCCALLAEVERLTAEVEAKITQNVSLIGQNGRLQQEVERLNALGSLQSADIQRLTRRVAENEADWLALRAEAATAFARGVAAMREAAAVWVEDFCSFSKAARIRALPDPEDKP